MVCKFLGLSKLQLKQSITRKFIRANIASIAAATTWKQPRNIEPIDAFPTFKELIGDYADYYRGHRIWVISASYKVYFLKPDTSTALELAADDHMGS